MALKIQNSGSARLVLFVLSKPPKQSKLINKLMNILEINPFSLPLHQRLCQSLEESDKGEYWLIRSKSLAQQEQRDEWRNSWMIWYIESCHWDYKKSYKVCWWWSNEIILKQQHLFSAYCQWSVVQLVAEKTSTGTWGKFGICLFLHYRYKNLISTY